MIIRRYKNRKLYNTSTSQYIRLSDVLALARQDIVSVFDKETLQDLTIETLLLALCQEHEGDQNEATLSKVVSFCRELVRAEAQPTSIE